MGLHPRIGNSFETTRAPGFKYFSRLGLSRSLELVRKNIVTTVAGLRSTWKTLIFHHSRRGRPGPSAWMRSVAFRQRSGRISTPTARAPNFCAAMMTTRPSPLPRS